MPKLFGKFKKIGERDPFEGRTDLCFLKHFQVLKKLGSGSYSQVYHVRRNEDGKEYALKATDMSKLSEVEKLSLIEEIRYLASLHHPNIVRYYEAFVEQHWLCIITELVLGGDIASYIRQHALMDEPIEEDKIWSIFIQTTLALDELHTCKLLHRDVKPENLLFNQQRIVKLTDFGISRILERIFTRTQIGTPYYMSPEMWARKPYSLSSDIWALGCVVLELCLLHRAFDGDTEADIRRAVVDGAPPLTPLRYSNELDSVIRQMLLRNPVERPTAAELLAMPVVRKRFSALPAALRTALRQHDSSAPRRHILNPIAMPAQLAQLNAHLPPAQYGDGGGIAFLLSRPMSSSDTDLKGLEERAGGDGLQRSSSADAVGDGPASAAEGDLALRPDTMRRNSVQVASLAVARMRRTKSGSKKDDWVCDPERGDPCFVGDRRSERASTNGVKAARAKPRGGVSFAEGPAPGEESDDAPDRGRRTPDGKPAFSLRTNSVSVADLGGRRTVHRSQHELEEELLKHNPDLRQLRATSFDLCPVARNSFYFPQTSRDLARGSISVRALPQRGAAGAPRQATAPLPKPNAPKNLPRAAPPTGPQSSQPAKPPAAAPSKAPAFSQAAPSGYQPIKHKKSANIFKRIFG